MNLKTKRDLRDRWASLIEEDLNRDGFWDDIDRLYKRDLTHEDVDEIEEFVRLVARQVRRGGRL